MRFNLQAALLGLAAISSNSNPVVFAENGGEAEACDNIGELSSTKSDNVLYRVLT